MTAGWLIWMEGVEINRVSIESKATCLRKISVIDGVVCN
jgi:hypothetical protein